jgi:heat shock protein HspQ
MNRTSRTQRARRKFRENEISFTCGHPTLPVTDDDGGAVVSTAWQSRGRSGAEIAIAAGIHSGHPLWRSEASWFISGTMKKTHVAKFQIGQVVKHRIFPFRGVIFDIDPEFNNTEEWYAAIPAEVRPRKDQPFYHLFAENAETEYVAYVSEQNLLPDTSGEPVRHPQVKEVFVADDKGGYRPRHSVLN